MHVTCRHTNMSRNVAFCKQPCILMCLLAFGELAFQELLVALSLLAFGEAIILALSHIDFGMPASFAS